MPRRTARCQRFSRNRRCIRLLQARSPAAKRVVIMGAVCWLRSAGINACGEMPDESERGFDVATWMGSVFRKQGQAATGREAFEKRVGEKACTGSSTTVPTSQNSSKAEWQSTIFGEMFVPIPRAYRPSLPVVPVELWSAALSHLLRGRLSRLQTLKRRGQSRG